MIPGKTLVLLGILIGAALLLSGCGGILPAATAVPVPEPARSEHQRILDPGVAPADLQELVDGNTAFAFDFYRAAGGEGDNLVYSPYSLSIALAMTYAGARGETAVQMAGTLHYTLPGDRLHPAFNALDLDLARRPEQAADVDPERRFEQSIVNSLWGQQDYPFLVDFLDTLALNYGSGMNLVDYVADPEGARLAINDWVSEQTRDRINDLVPQGIITTDTRLVLVNAIYFKATWLFPFDENLTADGPFTLLDGTRVQVPMMAMNGLASLSYSKGDGWQAVALPYAGGTAEMIVLVPDEGRFDGFEAGLDAAVYDQVLSEMRPRLVQLTMPRFDFTSEFMLRDTLSGMGMPVPFTPGAADFSGMTAQEALFISQVIHKAFIGVDEAGTEAAAATAVVMARESAMLSEPDVILTVDRPFIFVIRDVSTGTVLFAGRVLDPTMGE
jgi:serpin B